MPNEIKTCPACGAATLRKIDHQHLVNGPYADPRTVRVDFYRCETCGSEGDFSGEADAAISKAVESSRTESVQSTIAAMEARKVTMASMERALELPQRTLVKWKTGRNKPSASAVALMRMIRTFPWLVDVADSAYDYDVAQKIHIANAVTSLLKATTFSLGELSAAGAITSSHEAFVYAYFARDEEADADSISNTMSNETTEATLSRGYAGDA